MMADPMADMGQPQHQQPDADMNNGKEMINPVLLQLNLAKIDRIRSVMGIAAGCVTGICGYTGFAGLGALPLRWSHYVLMLTFAFSLSASPLFCTTQLVSWSPILRSVFRFGYVT